MTHPEARELLRDGARAFLAREPTARELDGVQAIAWAETRYGRGWKGAGAGSNNWGAIIATSPLQRQFPHGDENEQGSYTAGFRIYPSPADGAAAVAREVLRRPGVVEALAAGDVPAFSSALFGYYRARRGQSREHRIAEHARSVLAALDAIERGGVRVELGRVPAAAPSSSGQGSGAGELVALGVLAYLASRPRRRKGRAA